MRIRLEHEITDDGRMHVFTSPDLKGFYITGHTLEEATREALAMVVLIKTTMDSRPGIPVAVEFEDVKAA
jgi:hypothetical protein